MPQPIIPKGHIIKDPLKQAKAISVGIRPVTPNQLNPAVETLPHRKPIKPHTGYKPAQQRQVNADKAATVDAGTHGTEGTRSQDCHLQELEYYH